MALVPVQNRFGLLGPDATNESYVFRNFWNISFVFFASVIIGFGL